MDQFYLFSGLQINESKTVTYTIGPCLDTDLKYYTEKRVNWTNDPVKILGIWFHTNENLCHKLNFMDKFKKIETILDLWKTRNLTLIGKITIINSLVASQFNFQLATLPTPSEHFFKEYKRIMLDFLWDSKPHKVRYNKIIQDYDKGRLKLIALQVRNIALKATWPVYFADRMVPWMYYEYPIQDNRIWQANIDNKHINRIALSKKVIGNVHYDIWKAWSKINFVVPETDEEIQMQKLWGNTFITRAGLPIFDKKLVNSQLTGVRDLIADDGEYKMYYQIDQIIRGEVDLMLFNSIKSAIPPVWKYSCRNNKNDEEHQPLWKIIQNKKALSKSFYWLEINEQLKEDETYIRWQTELKINLDVKGIFRQIFKTTIDVKLRTFHYKILNKVLTTNLQRSKYDNNVSAKCSFCDLSCETILHLFVECSKVKKLWKAFRKWFKWKFQEQIDITSVDIIFNNYHNSKKYNQMINFMILVLKRYVYVVKCKQETLNFIDYLILV